ncbi:MAG: Mov34/MPN/PAD-1 family protein [Myxococcus sp.]|nr:Mov34/MPN/PAD-1 family protein [Myxococcus sp.]
MSREVFLLIGRGDAIVWSDAGETALALPDSRARWEALWRHRDELELVVHSHPLGPHAFSDEDESTMAAVEPALGKQLAWAVLSPKGLLVRRAGKDETAAALPWWATVLRLASGMPLSGT